MDIKVFEFLGEEVPGSIEDIRESLDLLSNSIDSALSNVGEKLGGYFENKDFKKVSELNSNSEVLDSMNKKIQHLISDLDIIIDKRNEEDSHITNEVSEKIVPNYNDYLVDMEVEHTLYEDFTYKRPCAFKIEETKIDVVDWKDVLVESINYLAKKDPNIIKSFIGDPKMNGKKVIYFSEHKLPTMRSGRKVNEANIYVETNLSANGIRNLLMKVLNKYNVKINDYKIYLKADYSELH